MLLYSEPEVIKPYSVHSAQIPCSSLAFIPCLYSRRPASFLSIVVNGVWHLGDDNTTISKCGILAVCYRLSCHTLTRITSE